MERFKINGEDLVKYYSEATTLSQVFSDIERDLRASQSVVCQYIVNGKEVQEEEEIIFSTWQLSRVDTLEFLSESVTKLVQDVIQGWIDSLPEFISQTEKVSKELKFEMNQKVKKSVVELIENCEYLVNSLIPLKSLLGDSVAAGLESVSRAESQFRKAITESITALEKKDFVLLADVIEYELITALDSWKAGLTELMVNVKEGVSIGPSDPSARNIDANTAGLGGKRLLN